MMGLAWSSVMTWQQAGVWIALSHPVGLQPLVTAQAMRQLMQQRAGAGAAHHQHARFGQ